MSIATVAPPGEDQEVKVKPLGKFVERPARKGKTLPQKQGPAPELSGPYFLLNARQADLTKEFDLSPQGQGFQIGSYVLLLERSIVHPNQSVLCCLRAELNSLETLIKLPYCAITKERSMMYVSTKVGTFRLFVLDANHVRFVPVND